MTAIKITKTTDIDITDINDGLGTRLRKPKTQDVKVLAESMARDGQLVPIIIAPNPDQDGHGHGFDLIAGAHRLEAAKSLGWTKIKASITSKDVTDDDDMEVIEIIENLRRVDLTEAQKAKQIKVLAAIRKRQDVAAATLAVEKAAATVEKKPEDADAAAALKAAKAVLSSVKSTKNDGLRSVARDTGMSKSSVAKLGKVAKVLGDDVLDEIAGTDLDSGVELSALADLTETAPEVAAEVVSKAKKAKAAGVVKAGKGKEKAASAVNAKKAKKGLAAELDALIAQTKAALKKFQGAVEQAIVEHGANSLVVNEAIDAVETLANASNDSLQALVIAQKAAR